MFEVDRCEECGCTNENACVTENGPCSWVDEIFRNLCSACYEKSPLNISEGVIP